MKVKAFISYSRRDRAYKNELLKFLKPLTSKFKLELFDDGEIIPGEKWEKRIWTEFDSSRIVLLLISANFLASEFCLNKEFKRAISRHRNGKVVVVPIILSECLWKEVPQLAELSAVPEDGESIRNSRFRSLDKGYTNAVNGINKLLSVLASTKPRRKKRRPPKPSLRQYIDTKYRAAFFDLDGTLVRGKVGHESFRYSWQLVWDHLGFPDAERRTYHQQYKAGEINYEQWCNIARDQFRRKGLSKPHFQQIARKVRLTKNCKETLEILRKRGVKTAIVSGGIDSFLEAVFPDYFDYFDYIFINQFNYDVAGILDSIESTPYDFDGKVDAIKHVCKTEGIQPAECAFVGEGPNDLAAVKWLNKEGGLTIGYPPERLGDDVAHSLWKDRLDAVLDIMFDKFRSPPELPFAK